MKSLLLALAVLSVGCSTVATPPTIDQRIVINPALLQSCTSDIPVLGSKDPKAILNVHAKIMELYWICQRNHDDLIKLWQDTHSNKETQ